MIYKRAKVDDVKGDEQCMMSQDDKRFVLKLVASKLVAWSFKSRMLCMLVALYDEFFLKRRWFNAWYVAWYNINRTYRHVSPYRR